MMPHTTSSSATRIENSTSSCLGEVYARHATKFLKYLKQGIGVLPYTASTAYPFCMGGRCMSPTLQNQRFNLPAFSAATSGLVG